MFYTPTDVEIQDAAREALELTGDTHETQRYASSPPWQREHEVPPPTNPAIPDALRPTVGAGPSDASPTNGAQRTRALGDLGDGDILGRTLTYLDVPRTYLDARAAGSKANAWKLVKAFFPADSKGRTLECHASPKYGHVGIPNPSDPTKANICGHLMVNGNLSNINKHLRSCHPAQWATASEDSSISVSGNARRQQNVAAVHGNQRQLPFWTNADQQAHNRRYVIFCAIDLRPQAMNTRLGFQMFATGLNPG